MTRRRVGDGSNQEFFRPAGMSCFPATSTHSVYFRNVPILLKKSVWDGIRCRPLGPESRQPGASRRGWRGHRDQLGELAEVLGGGSQVELVSGSVRSPQPEPVELQDALEVSEQHLDFLPLPP